MAHKEIMNIVSSTKLLFKDEDGKKYWHDSLINSKANSDCKLIIRFASLWARYMQYISETTKKPITEIAKATLIDVKNIIKNFSADTHIIAIFLLSNTWIYGDELVKWYQSNYDYSQDDIVSSIIR